MDRWFKDIAAWEKPTGGFYIWVKLNNNINLSTLFDEALKEKLLLNPGHIYDFEDNNAIRLSYAYASEEELKHGIEKLSKIVKRLLES